MFKLRYQKNIGAISRQEQEIIRRKKIMVVGCGSIGGFVIEGFARMGIGRMMVVDNEIFEQTNLNRQPFSTEKNIGKEKVYVARERVKDINSNVLFSGINDDIRNVKIEGVDIIIDCSNSIDTKSFLKKLSDDTDTMLISGAIGGWKGAVCISRPSGEIFEKTYIHEVEKLQSEGSLTYFSAGFIGSAIISQGVRMLLEREGSKEERLYKFDFENLNG